MRFKLITMLFLISMTSACKKFQLTWNLSQKEEKFVQRFDCESLNQLSTQFIWISSGPQYYETWEIDPSGFSGNCLIANNNQVYGLGVQQGYIEFNHTFQNNGYVRFRVDDLGGHITQSFETKWNKLLYAHRYDAKLFIDDVAQGEFYLIPSQNQYKNPTILDNIIWPQLKSNIIQPGTHNIRIQFNFTPPKVDEIEIIEFIE